jgi:hypothetical protein
MNGWQLAVGSWQLAVGSPRIGRPVAGFEALEVWQRAVEWSVSIYREAQGLKATSRRCSTD